MDGYELCRRIKDTPDTRELPVILLTSLSDPNDILKGLECGADNFIVKPYDEEFLLSRIHTSSPISNSEKIPWGRKEPKSFSRGRNTISPRSASIPSTCCFRPTRRRCKKISRSSRRRRRWSCRRWNCGEKNAEMEADLNMARELQTAFLPSSYPSFPPGPAEKSSLAFLPSLPHHEGTRRRFFRCLCALRQFRRHPHLRRDGPWRARRAGDRHRARPDRGGAVGDPRAGQIFD